MKKIKAFRPLNENHIPNLLPPPLPEEFYKRKKKKVKTKKLPPKLE